MYTIQWQKDAYYSLIGYAIYIQVRKKESAAANKLKKAYPFVLPTQFIHIHNANEKTNEEDFLVNLTTK